MSILLPESFLRRTEEEAKSSSADIKRAEYVNSVRFSITQGLQALALHMDHHEQTCHGIIGPVTFEQTIQALVECWENPSSYNVSSLAQYCRKLSR